MVSDGEQVGRDVGGGRAKLLSRVPLRLILHPRCLARMPQPAMRLAHPCLVCSLGARTNCLWAEYHKYPVTFAAAIHCFAAIPEGAPRKCRNCADVPVLALQFAMGPVCVGGKTASPADHTGKPRARPRPKPKRCAGARLELMRLPYCKGEIARDELSVVRSSSARFTRTSGMTK